jgi:hypothetical protein
VWNIDNSRVNYSCEKVVPGKVNRDFVYRSQSRQCGTRRLEEALLSGLSARPNLMRLAGGWCIEKHGGSIVNTTTTPHNRYLVDLLSCPHRRVSVLHPYCLPTLNPAQSLLVVQLGAEYETPINFKTPQHEEEHFVEAAHK